MTYWPNPLDTTDSKYGNYDSFKQGIKFPMNNPPEDTNLQELANMDNLQMNCAVNHNGQPCPGFPHAPTFLTKDSGQRQEFESGMIRDVTTGKLELHRVAEGPMLERWGGLLTRGGVKYPDVSPGIANWTLANGEAEYQRFRQSAFRHFFQWWSGQVDEDHAAAVFFNINGAEYTKAKIKANDDVPTDLHDLRQG